MSAIVRLLGLCARCWESTAPSATIRAELGACPDAVREMVGDAKLEHDQLRAELAKAEARVKAALNYYEGQGSVCDHMREMVRLLNG